MQIEPQAGLCDERNVPGLQILQGVEQIEHRPAPVGEFCDQNGVDIAGLSQGKDLLSLGALILHPRGSFLPYPDDSIPGFLGEGAEIPLPR
jgi:hypothetical protein